MDKDKEIKLTLTLTPHRALRLVHAMRWLADKASVEGDYRYWRDQANLLADQCKGVVIKAQGYVIRPQEDDEVALERVLRGEADPPVLSIMDTRRVIAELGDEVSARHLAYILYMSPRSVSRWRSEYRRGVWKKYGIE